MKIVCCGERSSFDTLYFPFWREWDRSKLRINIIRWHILWTLPTRSVSDSGTLQWTQNSSNATVVICKLNVKVSAGIIISCVISSLWQMHWPIPAVTVVWHNVSIFAYTNSIEHESDDWRNLIQLRLTHSSHVNDNWNKFVLMKVNWVVRCSLSLSARRPSES